MPYSRPDEAPKYVPPEFRSQWIAVWNQEYQQHGDEGRAFKTANGVVRKRKEGGSVEAYEAAIEPKPTEPPQNISVESITDKLKTDPLALSDLRVQDAGCTLLSATMPLLQWNNKETTYMPVVKAGSWHRNGGEFGISSVDLDSIVHNFQKRKNHQVVIDYEHASEHPDVAKAGAVPAAGWIHNLFRRGDELYALVEWTPQARGMIKTGQYRFFSPALSWGFEDKEHGGSQGCTMTSGALTNHPFLEELPPIMLSDVELAEAELAGLQQVHVPAPVNSEPKAAEANEYNGGEENKTESASESASEPASKSPEISIASKQSEALVSATCEGEGEGEVKAGEVKADATEQNLAEGKTKKVDGVDLPSSAFLIVGDPEKTDTWHLPVHFPSAEQTKSHIQNALGRFNQTQGANPEVARKLARLAKSHGINVDEFKKHLQEISKLTALAEVLAELAENTPKEEKPPMAKSSIKKIEDGKFKGRSARFDEKGKMLNMLPAGMTDEAMADYCAELDEAWHDGDAEGMGQPETPNQEKEANVTPRGNFLADGAKEKETKDDDGDEPDGDECMADAEEEKPKKEKLSDAQILSSVLYADNHQKRGRINLSEASRLTSTGRLDASDILRVQAAQEKVDDAIRGNKFLPKQRRLLMAQAMSDSKAFDELVASQPKIVQLGGPMGLSKGPNAAAGESFLTGVQQLLDERRKADAGYDYSQALREYSKDHSEEWPAISEATVVEF